MRKEAYTYSNSIFTFYYFEPGCVFSRFSMRASLIAITADSMYLALLMHTQSQR